MQGIWNYGVAFRVSLNHRSSDDLPTMISKSPGTDAPLHVNIQQLEIFRARSSTYPKYPGLNWTKLSGFFSTRGRKKMVVNTAVSRPRPSARVNTIAQDTVGLRESSRSPKRTSDVGCPKNALLALQCSEIRVYSAAPIFRGGPGFNGVLDSRSRAKHYISSSASKLGSRR